jgi:hypothetical protein
MLTLVVLLLATSTSVCTLNLELFAANWGTGGFSHATAGTTATAVVSSLLSVYAKNFAASALCNSSSVDASRKLSLC